MSALLPVQTAEFELLSGDTILASLAPGGVHDEVPPATAFPYVVIGAEPTKIPDDTLTESGEDITSTIHVFSKARGNAEVLRIMDRIEELLDGQTLDVVGWRAWRVEAEFSTVLREVDADRVVRHGVQRYRITLE